MSKEAVKVLFGRLLSEPMLRREFFKEPKTLVKEMGLDLDRQELEAIVKLKPRDLDIQFAQDPSTVGKIVVSKVTT